MTLYLEQRTHQTQNNQSSLKMYYNSIDFAQEKQLIFLWVDQIGGIEASMCKVVMTPRMTEYTLQMEIRDFPPLIYSLTPSSASRVEVNSFYLFNQVRWTIFCIAL